MATLTSFREMMVDMEIEMEEAGESGCSSTTTTSNEEQHEPWNDLDLMVDWGPFTTNGEDFYSLIESMMCVADNNAGDIIEAAPPLSTITSAGTPPRYKEEEEEEEENDKGLRLVHLLMAAAEAMEAGPTKSRDLAAVILARLKELAPPAGGGSNIERLSVHFTDALQGILDGGARNSATANRYDHRHHQEDLLAAFQLLQDMSPYVKFGHFTANQAILESVAGERRVHIVDFDIMEGVQWASLMQALVSGKDAGSGATPPPPPHLRITAVNRGGGGGGRKGAGTVQETGRRLAAFAASIGQPFSFGQCRLDADEKFRPATVKLVKGEAVALNCALHAPHLPRQRTAGSVASFLSAAAALGARVVTVVEEEAEFGEERGFVGRFMEELHRYSAMWDSLEAGFPMQGRARGLVERAILGPRIAGAVERFYRRDEAGEAEGGWGEWMSGLGFRRVGISCFNHCQARLLLGLFHDGYRVEEVALNKLVLGWKSRRLLSASVWAAPPAAAAAREPSRSVESSDLCF